MQVSHASLHPVGRVGLLLMVPMLLAWLADQSLLALGFNRFPLTPPPLPARGLAEVLLWGPLVETAMLLCAAAAVTQAQSFRQPNAQSVTVCAGIIGIAFVSSHLIQNGPAAFASLPMAVLLSTGAVYTVQKSDKRLWVRCGWNLFAIHAIYNATLLWMDFAL